MQWIDLDGAELEAKTGHTSKGDQPKWRLGEHWYKADHLGYEALAEVIISALLKKSNVQNVFCTDALFSRRHRAYLIGWMMD